MPLHFNPHAYTLSLFTEPSINRPTENAAIRHLERWISEVQGVPYPPDDLVPSIDTLRELYWEVLDEMTTPD